MHAFAAVVAAHEPLKRLRIIGRYATRGVNALFDAAAERRILHLMLVGAFLDAESIPALARLLQRGSLTELAVSCNSFPDAEEASVLALCDALRACRTLTRLELRLNPAEGTTRRVVAELLDAAASLPVLSTLDLSRSRIQDAAAFGHALCALLAANLPSLRFLDVQSCHLGDEGLGPLLDGLAANTHLRRLDCRIQNDLSEAFERDRLEPAMTELAARRERDAQRAACNQPRRTPIARPLPGAC